MQCDMFILLNHQVWSKNLFNEPEKIIIETLLL